MSPSQSDKNRGNSRMGAWRDLLISGRLGESGLASRPRWLGLAAVAFSLITLAVAGCATDTLIAVTSNPPRAEIYVEDGNTPGFHPVRLQTVVTSSGLLTQVTTTSPGSILTTPDSVYLRWLNIKRDYALLKVIWTDGAESEPAKVIRGSPSLSIHFAKGAPPAVNMEK